MKKKRLVGLFMLLTLLLPLIIPAYAQNGGQQPSGAPEPASPTEASPTNGRELVVGSDIIITKGTFQASVGGQPVQGSNVPRNADIRLDFEFEVDNDIDILNGDFFSVPLPTELTSIAVFEALGAGYPLSNSDGTYAYLTLVNDKAVITFTDLIEVNQLTLDEAEFHMSGSLDDSRNQEGANVSFRLFADGTVYTISVPPKVIPQKKPATVNKSGSYNAQTGLITWSVTVDPRDDAPIANVTLVDTPDGKHEYQPNTTVGASEPTKIGNAYHFTLANVAAATTVTYQTKPLETAFNPQEDKSANVKNDVELYTNDPATATPTDTAEGTATITTNWLEKQGSRSGDEINWTITVNNNLRTIPAGSVLKDIFPGDSKDFMDYVPNTLTMDGSPIPHIAGDVLYTFAAPTSGKHVFTLKTKVNANYKNQQSVTSLYNNVSLELYNAETITEESDGVYIGTSLLRKAGAGYDKATHTITWKMTVNENGRSISNAKISDAIPTNQVFDEIFAVERDNVKLPRLTATPTDDPGYYYDDTTHALSVNLGTLTDSQKPVIVFKTKVKNENHYGKNASNPYSNTATLTGVEIQPSTSTGNQTVSSTVLTKSGKYSFKRVDGTPRYELEWTIAVNDNQMPMQGVKVTDGIPSGQAYVDGSLRIDGVEPAAGQFTPGTNTWELSLGDITGKKVITYRTEVTDPNIFLNGNGNLTFGNEATLAYTDPRSGLPLSQKVAPQVSVGNTALSKGVYQEFDGNTGTIGWEVKVNGNQAPLTQAKLIDQLQEGLELDTDSVALYYWDGSNATQPAGALVPPEDYAVAYNGLTRLFTLSLPDGAQGYWLRFQTDVLKPNVTYSNSIQFDFNGQSMPLNNASQRSIFVSTSDFGGSASGKNGSITVKKVDELNNPIMDAAVFELLDSKGNVMKEETTVGGELTFSPLKLRTFYVREKTAPAGYVPAAGERAVTLSAADNAQTVSVTNVRAYAKVRIIKHDQSGNGLANAEFALYDAQNNEVETALSAASGIAEFASVPVGTYTVREKTAPHGYLLSAQQATVQVGVEDHGQVIATNPSIIVNIRDNSVPLPTPTPTVAPTATPTPTPTPGNGSGNTPQPGGPSNPGYGITPQPQPNPGNELLLKGTEKPDSLLVVPTGSVPGGALLPKTGGAVDTTVLLIAGGVLLLAGIGAFAIRKLAVKKR